MTAIRGGGGMRAITCPSSGGGGVGGGPGYGGGGFEPQPMVWVLVVLMLAGPFAVCFGIDVLSAGWCHFDGCTSSHYLADLVHAALVAVAVLAGLVAGAVAYRRRWHVTAARIALVLLTHAVWASRRARARRVERRRAAGTTVRATVVAEDVVDVEFEDVPPAALTATRPQLVDVEVLVGGARSERPVPRTR